MSRGERDHGKPELRNYALPELSESALACLEDHLTHLDVLAVTQGKFPQTKEDYLRELEHIRKLVKEIRP